MTKILVGNLRGPEGERGSDGVGGLVEDPEDEGTYLVAPGVISGTGTPEGAVVGVVGAMYLRTDGGAGTTLYVKEAGSGNTGWAAK